MRFKRAGMITTDCVDELIKEIEKYLSEFCSQDLIEGSRVRDAFLDLRSTATRSQRETDEREQIDVQ